MWVSQGVRKKKSGGDERNRTADLYVANVSLSHLSYTPTLVFWEEIPILFTLDGEAASPKS